MKKCVPCIRDRIFAVLVIVFCAAIAVIVFRQAISKEELTLPALAVVLLFGGVSIYMLWSMICTGNWGFFYNEEKIIFVLSRKDRLEFRWEDLSWAQENAKLSIFYQPSPEAWNFCFPGKRRIRQISAVPSLSGYEELAEMFRKKEVQALGTAGHVDFDKEMADEIFKKAFGRPLYQKNRKEP